MRHRKLKNKSCETFAREIFSKMSVEEEVKSIRTKLEKMTKPGADQSQALDILKALSRVDMSLVILTTTRIGMAVNALRYLTDRSLK